MSDVPRYITLRAGESATLSLLVDVLALIPLACLMVASGGQSREGYTLWSSRVTLLPHDISAGDPVRDVYLQAISHHRDLSSLAPKHTYQML